MSQQTLRRFLMFRELIHRSPDPTRRVDTLLEQHPDWDPEEKRSWESWKDADLPEYKGFRDVETVETRDGL